MKISAFYENIVTGAEASGIGMRAALERLKKAGMDRIYLMPQSWEKDKELLKEALPALGLEVEGLHSWILFPKNPSDTSYRGVIDLAAVLGAEHVLFVPGMLTEGNTRRDINSILAGMRAAVAYGSEKGIHVLMEDFDCLPSTASRDFNILWTIFRDSDVPLIPAILSCSMRMNWRQRLSSRIRLSSFILKTAP